MLGQHAGLLSADSLLLQQHAQIPVSLSTSQGGVGIQGGAVQLDSSHLSSHQQNENMSPPNQNQIARDVRVSK